MLDIDAVFTDVDMPGGLSGIDLAKMLVSPIPRVGIAVTS
ncbi:DNA-binding LytR/AlgR family response regulator [Rhizobium sp. BE258]|nr:DNA-binding LytR/AlgR family response regulator [Rhizobium sp. BE258]